MNIKTALPILTGALLVALFATVPASAQTTLGITTTATAKVDLSAARLPKIISRSDAAIAARLTSLANLNTRIQAMKNVSTNEKVNFSNEIQTNVTGLNSLKAKIDADTDVTVALTDEKSIYGSYRIYALVIPQGYIAASADRVETITAMMTAISAKLQLRIAADQTAGKDVTAMQASLTDINAKVTDATAQAQTAQSAVVSLTPDQGNATVLASNTTALKAARANIKVSTQDLVTARADAKTILQDLKNLGA